MTWPKILLSFAVTATLTVAAVLYIASAIVRAVLGGL